MNGTCDCCGDTSNYLYLFGGNLNTIRPYLCPKCKSLWFAYWISHINDSSNRTWDDEMRNFLELLKDKATEKVILT